ncbi:hypothetical protein U9M48_036207 [Paspalum notatum var. saurae]|uniref:CCHC-type domain-containing protein n=1 Tax=Paspalum notatum var. saurae TaxID=547442 RepID=A0AAQ3UE38_PASNO
MAWIKEKQRGDTGSSSSRGRGRRRGKSRRKACTGKPKEDDGKAAAKDKCLNCGKAGHWVRNCCAPRHREQANLALLACSSSVAEEAEEPALLMARAKETGGAPVRFEEPRAHVNLGREGKEEKAERWYLDSSAINHMTGSRGAFSELDSSITGTVKFGDNFVVDIAGQGAILFSCSDGGH